MGAECFQYVHSYQRCICVVIINNSFSSSPMVLR